MRRWLGAAPIGLGLALLAAAGLWGTRPRTKAPAAPEDDAATPARAAVDATTEAAEESSHLFVLAINGGGSPAQNFKSHLLHLQGMVDLLHSAGVPDDHITVLSSDGADPTPDLLDRTVDLGRDEWRLHGTELEVPLSHLAALSSSVVTGATLFPATRGALSIWVMTVGQQLRAGDTLLLYVTDHGSLGAKPDENRIVLWGPDATLSVQELRDVLETLDPEVRVVALMSQCYSGGFAQLATPRTGDVTGKFCGFFSTTSTQKAYGCYAETRDNPKVGHSFAFLQALPAAAGRLSIAHELAQEFDDTPDVPVRTSELFLADLLTEAARSRRLGMPTFVDDLLQSTWANTPALSLQAQRLDRLSERFGLPTVRSAAELARLSATLHEALSQLRPISVALDNSLAEDNRQELGRFLDNRTDLKLAVEPAALKAMDFDRRVQFGKRFLYDLSTFYGGRASPARVDRDTVEHLVFRMQVRLASIARLETVLVTIAGQHYLESAPTQREAMQRLVDCEALDLQLPPTTWVTSTPALPPLGQDLIQARELIAREALAGLVKKNTLGMGARAPELQLVPYRGPIPPPGKRLLLFFWASWCKACKYVVPSLLGWAERHDVHVLAITDEDTRTLDQFFGLRQQFPALIARDPERRLFSQFGVRSLPSFALLDEQRKLVSPVTSSLQDLAREVDAAPP